MERCRIRRRSLLDSLFEPWQTIGEGVGARVLSVDPARFAPAAPLAIVSDGTDDLLWSPGELVVRSGGEVAEQIGADERFARADLADEGLARFRVRDDRPLGQLATTLELIGRFAASGELAPVHGFIAHQKMHGGTDPESTAVVAEPADFSRGRGASIAVVDTGLAESLGWTSLALRPTDAGDVDPLGGVSSPSFLGRAAGHGTFVASLCLQVAPGASVSVGRVANTDGFIDEFTLAAHLDAIGRAGDPPDVVVMSFGGYSVKLGSFGTIGSGTTWSRPLVLEGAVRRLLQRCPDAVLVASAGNNDSSDPCYPAAFAADKEFAGRVVSVAALDSAGYRWDWSNYGSWVTASTLGVRLRSLYVEGREDPANDPDGRPETFRSPSFASWTGTSFAAPLVAGRIVELQRALVTQLGRAVPATEAWAILRASSKPQREGLCGVHVVVDGVAHS